MVKSKIMYLVCAAYFVAGYSVYTTPVQNLDLIRQVDPSITAHTNMFSLHQIGAIFMVTSALCVLLASVGKKTSMAYAIMTFLLSWWALLYVVSWVQTGYWQSVYGLVNYGLTAGLLIMCSRIVEMPKGIKESMGTPLPLAELDLRLKEGDKL